MDAVMRVRTGYSGVDDRGRPIGPTWSDNVPTQDLVVIPPDPVVRRRATPQELARLEPAPVAPVVRPGLAMHLVRPASRPAPRAVPLAEPTRAPVAIAIPSHPEESPVTEPVDPPATPYAGIAIPCTTCLHEPVCYLRREIPADPRQLLEPMIMGPGLRLVTAGVRVECDHHLVSTLRVVPASSDAERLAASRSRGNARMLEEKAKAARHPSKAGEAQEKAERAERALAALDRWKGDARKAAAEIGMRPNAFAMVVKYAQARRAAAESQVVAS